MSRPKTNYYTRPGPRRNIGISPEDNRIFKQILLDLYDIGVFRTPDQLADEIFRIGLYVKKEMLNT